MSQSRDLVEQKGNQIVHIRGDSDSDLEALFNAIINPTDTQVPLTVPMRLRKLPNSFFKPPDTGSKTSQSVSHSRESSTDSTSASPCFSPGSSNGTPGQSQPSPGQAGQAPPPQAPQSAGSQGAPSPQQAGRQGGSNGLPVHHPRAHSSPASLQQSLAAGTGQQQHQHLRQQSYDITDDVPLPPGWEMAKTPSGQRYFLNHITQTTTWDDPRKKMSMSAVNIHSPSSSSPSPPINPLSPQNLGPLPEGWEQASTPEGEIYFINHQSRTTSWFDPRIPMHLQRPAVLQQALQNPQPPSLLPASAPQTTAPTSSQPPTNQIAIQQRQQRVRLQRLQMERERLRLRQQEIMRQLKISNVNSYGQPNLISNVGRPNYMDREQQRLQQQDVLTHQEMILRQTLGEPITSSPSSEMTPVTTTDIDPFLGGNDFHSRQESGDSGLGMSTNYSLPHTPEDFLTTMDDSMDPASDDGSQCGQQHNSELGTLDLQGSDLTSLGDTNNMDSDDLEPSLQEELSSDILNDVEALLSTNRIDNVLTWL